MRLKISNNYSPNFSIPKRKNKMIKFIVIHYTGMKSENAAIKRLCDESKNVSAHYFIKKNGEMINLVPDLYVAWHAGKSKWLNYNSLNKNSIGIEIQNPGHENKYKNFSTKQLNSLKILLRTLIKKYKIDLKNILGHSDIAPERKKDPGEKFPWKNLANHKLAIWHSLKKSSLKKNRKIRLNNKDEEITFIKNLNKIGYRVIKRLDFNSYKKFITKAFQRRFRQNLVNGIPDQECFLISKNLLKS
jgi:N-acetylmuramoyl-L-alanine amidase